MMISIIVPVKKINKYINKNLIPSLKKQSYQNFELIVVPDKDDKRIKCPLSVKIIPSWPQIGPADKRDLGVSKAKGKIVAFIDDDAYPEKDWLKQAIKYFKNSKIAAVCGPGITPKNNNIRQKASGWVWSTYLGAGGAGIYRNWPSKKRSVDDYPSFNLIVRKADFEKVGGFNSHFWPGEDTKLCHDLVYGLKKKIIYDPKILVYHQRREVFRAHLIQILRFAIHRGHFARILPKTSFRLPYFIPSLFVLSLVLGLILSMFFPTLQLLYLALIGTYLVLLFLTGIKIYVYEKDVKLSLLAMSAIFLTHLSYGCLFIKGFFTNKLKQ